MDPAPTTTNRRSETGYEQRDNIEGGGSSERIVMMTLACMTSDCTRNDRAPGVLAVGNHGEDE